MLTGIELGPSSCVLVRTRREGSVRGGAATTIDGARTFDARHQRVLASALGRARREDGFDARARVVAWGAPGAQIALDLDRLPDVSALIEAGFEIESIVSPPQALAMMLEAMRIDSQRAVAAVALNRAGVALAIIHHGQIVAARTFAWPLGEPFTGTRSELLERYLVIAQLAPQLTHLIDLAAPVYDAPVSSVVICGDLPDLRSLSMLLIEETDLDVETLDSAEMLAPAVAQRADSAAALHLAAAVTVPPDRAPAVPAVDRARGGAYARRSLFTATAMRGLVGAAAIVLCAAWATMQVAGSTPAAPAFRDGLAATAKLDPPARSAPQPEATIGRLDPEPAPPPPAPVAPRSAPPAPARIPAARSVPIEPLIAADPLPRVDGIAIAATRRLAIVDGAIVGVGDRVGRRTVKRIDTDGITLRDPGGGDVFVAIRARKPPG